MVKEADVEQAGCVAIVGSLLEPLARLGVVFRFSDSGGWGWAAFDYDEASGTFRPASVQAASRKRREVRAGVPH